MTVASLDRNDNVRPGGTRNLSTLLRKGRLVRYGTISSSYASLKHGIVIFSGYIESMEDSMGRASQLRARWEVAFWPPVYPEFSDVTSCGEENDNTWVYILLFLTASLFTCSRCSSMAPPLQMLLGLLARTASPHSFKLSQASGSIPHRDIGELGSAAASYSHFHGRRACERVLTGTRRWRRASVVTHFSRALFDDDDYDICK